jgi:calcium-dependent protein kinase
LRRAALNIFVKMCQPKEYDYIAEAFRNFDKDCSGTIEVEELRKILKEANFSSIVNDKEIEDIIKQIDNDNNGKINYSEFIAATIDIKKYLTKARVEALFKSFDVDDTNEIDATNLKNAFTKLGKAISDADIK